MSSNTQSSHELERHERNQARGLKAAITNPNVSDEAKENAQERLNEMGYSYDDDKENTSGTRQTRQSGASSGAAADSGELDEIDERISQGKNEGNVIGGYKAILKNPNVSEEAKQHAQELLENHDAI